MAKLAFPPHECVCVWGGERYPGHAKRTCATRRRAPVRGEHKPGHVKRTCGTRKGGNREGETRAWLRQTHQGPIPGHWCMLRLYCAVLTPPVISWLYETQLHFVFRLFLLLPVLFLRIGRRSRVLFLYALKSVRGGFVGARKNCGFEGRFCETT